MDLKERYFKQKEVLLKSANAENQRIFNEFFTYQERKLKRINGLSNLDSNTYRTLYGYVMRFKNVLKWFDGKAWSKLTKQDILKVYDDLEDGKILTSRGQPFKDRDDYYSKIFKSKPFEVAGVADVARKVIEYSKPNKNEVRYIEEPEFIKLVEHAYKPIHKVLMWLAWDYGENINSLLQLRKKDFTRQISSNTNEPEYLLNFRNEILKRSRTARGETNIHVKTTILLDSFLEKLENREDKLFNFEYRQAKKVLDNAIKHSGAVCSPAQDNPTWKDFRSGMACYLLRNGFNRDEINRRLGHKPSSVEIDKYINFLALDKSKPKERKHHSDMHKLQRQVEKLEMHNRMNSDKIKNLTNIFDGMRLYLRNKNHASESDLMLLRLLDKSE